MKGLQPKELYEFIILKKYIHKFVRLNTRTSKGEILFSYDDKFDLTKSVILLREGNCVKIFDY